jgi:hypothetical protein
VRADNASVADSDTTLGKTVSDIPQKIRCVAHNRQRGAKKFFIDNGRNMRVKWFSQRSRIAVPVFFTCEMIPI